MVLATVPEAPPASGIPGWDQEGNLPAGQNVFGARGGPAIVHQESRGPVHVPSTVVAGLLLQKTIPVYPPIAIAVRAQGTVTLQATISKTGTIENLRDNLRETINHYHKDVMVVETAYPTRDVNPTPAARKNMIWPMTPEGQKQFLADVIETVKEAPEGRGIGVNYWRPEETYVHNPNGRSWGPDANSVFDDKGYPLPAMNVLNSQPSQPVSQAMR